MKRRKWQAVAATAIILLSLGAAATVADAAPSPRAKSAAKLRAFDRSHAWVTAAKVKSCRPARTAVICFGALRGVRGGVGVVCPVRLRVARQVKVRVQRCRPVIAPTKQLALHAHLSRAVQNPADPLEVEYDYSASATQEVPGFAVEEEAPLPSGVLALYTDGILRCAMNVGGVVEGGECEVDHDDLGEHTITSIYSSGERSAATTEVQTVGPYPTTANVSASYEALAVPEEAAESWYRIGRLTVTWSATPATAFARLDCGEAVLAGKKQLTASGCLEVNRQGGATVLDVYEFPGGCDEGRNVGPVKIGDLAQADELEQATIEGGGYSLRAEVDVDPFLGDDDPNFGYGESASSLPLQFDVEWSC